MSGKIIECMVCGGKGKASDWEWNAGEPCEMCEGTGQYTLPKSPIDYISDHINYDGEGSWHDCANSMSMVIREAKKLYEGDE